jgi:hypothetical protein
VHGWWRSRQITSVAEGTEVEVFIEVKMGVHLTKV